MQFLTKSWLFPAILVIFALIAIVHQTNFSVVDCLPDRLVDRVADRVIEKLDADYSPFGPSGPVEPGN